jgi:hypothetical protein
MGCDIHAVVEVGSNPLHPEGNIWWHTWADYVYIMRDYVLFGHLANVRMSGVFQPKGLPNDYSYSVREAVWLKVVDDQANPTGEDEIDAITAQTWVDSGSSKFEQRHGTKYVSNPDWHSHSWLSLVECKQVIEQYSGSIEFNALVAAMDILADKYDHVRIVFWFDN